MDIEKELQKVTTRWKNLKGSVDEFILRIDKIEMTIQSGMTELVKNNFKALSEGLKRVEKGNKDGIIETRKLNNTIQQLQQEMIQLKQELNIIKSKSYGSGATELK